MMNSLLSICTLEEISRKNCWINEVHPLMKLLITIVFILIVSSNGKYEISELILLTVYPMIIILISKIDFNIIAKKLLVPMITGVSLGIANPLYDKTLVHIASFTISAGWLSLLVLLVKSMLIVSSTLILVATTKIEDIAYALRMLRMPKIMVLLLLITFRYINILMKEADRAIVAYSIRSERSGNIRFSDFGFIVSKIFMGCTRRAYELYQSMMLRGFTGELQPKVKKIRLIDYIYFSTCIILLSTLVGMGNIL
jgi:cobalt/nickel transport system permease protein